MTVDADAWQRMWTQLGASEVPRGLFNQLVAAYSERHRRYHTLQHLRECLAHLDAAVSLTRRPAEVELALWFHDAVHDPRARATTRSAAPTGRAAACWRRTARRQWPNACTPW